MHSAGPAPRAGKVLLGALSTLGLTAAHHAYGAHRYGTPWRLHGALVAAGIGLALLAFFAVHRREPRSPSGRAAAWILALATLAFPVIAVGAFEGAYNHVAKNALFFAGAPWDVLAALFPPPAYEMPDDAVFEITGVLQVVPAAFAAREALRLVRALRLGARRERRLHLGPSRQGGTA